MTENFSQAFSAIKANRLRTVLTILIIAFGIMALVGILTAIDSIKSQIYSNFSLMGANTFTVRQKWVNMQESGGDDDWKPCPPVTYLQSKNFKDRLSFPCYVSISCNAGWMKTIKNGSKKTNPNVSVTGVDENYLRTAGLEIGKGRFLTKNEIDEGKNFCLLGVDVVKKIFSTNADPLGAYINVGDRRYQVIGVLRSKGSSFVGAGDNIVLIPLLDALRNYTGMNGTVRLSVSVNSISQLQPAIDEATSIMRNVRGLKVNEDNDFDIITSDQIAGKLISNIAFVTMAATLIGFITLLGAAIGLMNIMLVSVTERTREIGISKALGATKQIIRTQFLVEAIVICQLGGLLGIVLGILIGNLVSMLLNGAFIIPWLWIGMGILICLVVGLFAGLYPAIKASNLDPIESLLYE